MWWRGMPLPKHGPRSGSHIHTRTPYCEAPPHGCPEIAIERLRLVAAGRSNREIGTELFIAVKTASVHVSNILAKLNVPTRAAAAAAAHRLHLLDPS